MHPNDATEEPGGSLIDARIPKYERQLQFTLSQRATEDWMLQKIIENDLSYGELNTEYSHVDPAVRESSWNRYQQRESMRQKAQTERAGTKAG